MKPINKVKKADLEIETLKNDYHFRIIFSIYLCYFNYKLYQRTLLLIKFAIFIGY